MNQISCLCYTAFLVFLMSSGVAPQTEEMKQLAAVIVGDYYPVQDDLNMNVKRYIIKQVYLPQLNFGNRITFFTDARNDTDTMRGSVYVLNYSGGIYTFQHYKILNVSSVANPEGLTEEQVKFLGHDCDKPLTLDGSNFYGIHPACALPFGSDGKPLVFHVKFNCTDYTFTTGGKNIVFRPHRRFTLPDELKPANPLC